MRTWHNERSKRSRFWLTRAITEKSRLHVYLEDDSWPPIMNGRKNMRALQGRIPLVCNWWLMALARPVIMVAFEPTSSMQSGQE